jgi:hypothetical protein
MHLVVSSRRIAWQKSLYQVAASMNRRTGISPALTVIPLAVASTLISGFFADVLCAMVCMKKVIPLDGFIRV